MGCKPGIVLVGEQLSKIDRLSFLSSGFLLDDLILDEVFFTHAEGSLGITI